jgi:DNA helicase-2/ATP-dependent DNA helicase PcrA
MISLEAAYGRLSERQKKVILSTRNTVVLAGPGSGKTDTIVLKAAHLLREVLPPTRGLAVLTFNNDTAREIAERLRRFGHERSRRLYCGTLHSFALNAILRAFGPVLTPPIGPVEVVTESKARTVWLEVFDEVGLVENPDWNLERRVRTRRALAMGEDVSGEDDRMVAACVAFDSRLVATNQVDFEGILLRAYALLAANRELAKTLGRKYPWILIDEYQDLGVVLHRLTLLLADSGVHILAVGDPDQSIYGFTGAEPGLMAALHEQAGFDREDLQFNYRSGARIISASFGALGEARATRPSPDRADPGLVTLIDVEGGLDAQANHLADEVIPDLISAGVQPHEIAVLYPARGQLPTSLRTALERADIGYVSERDTRFPGGPIGRWLQRCARRGVDPDSLDAEPIAVLVGDLQRWIAPSQPLDGLPGLRAIWRVVKAAAEPGARLTAWIQQAERELDLINRLPESEGAEDRDEYQELLDAVRDPAVGMTTVAEFAEGARVSGKVVLTTYHSSKGRQFDAVVLPGLQEEIVPRMRWDRFTRRMAISPRELLEQRRLFYVGLTRARKQVVLVSSDTAHNDKGFPIRRSRFVEEVRARLPIEA